MQIVCPDCTTSYQISAAALGPAGRMVRCAHCSHQWFAQPVAEMAEASAGDDNGYQFEPHRYEDHRRDESRFDAADDEASREPGYDHAPPGWADPVGQWSVEPIPEDEVVQFAPVADEIEFAPPSDIEAVDDAPPTAPAGLEGEGAADLESVTTAPGAPDYFELQRRRKARAGLKSNKRNWVTTPRLAAAFAAVLALLIFERSNIVRLMPQTASLFAAIGLPVNLRGLVFEDVRTVTETQDAVPVLVIEGTVRNITRSPTDVPRLRFAMRNGAGADIYSWTAVPETAQIPPGGVMGFRTRLASPPAESRSAYVRFVQRRDLVAASR